MFVERFQTCACLIRLLSVFSVLPSVLPSAVVAVTNRWPVLTSDAELKIALANNLKSKLIRLSGRSKVHPLPPKSSSRSFRHTLQAGWTNYQFDSFFWGLLTETNCFVANFSSFLFCNKLFLQLPSTGQFFSFYNPRPKVRTVSPDIWVGSKRVMFLIQKERYSL